MGECELNRVQTFAFAAEKGEMQSADKTTIITKVMHVYVSTTALANDIQVVRFIPYLDSDSCFAF